jgi:dCTP deaminase
MIPNMVLSDRDIKKNLQNETIKILPPLDTKNISACSLDLKLSNEFYVFEYSNMPYLDTSDPNLNIPVKKITVKEGDIFILQPKEFALGSTVEHIEIPDTLVGKLEGRSSLARLGLVVHSTASLIDPGWRGQITLELGNIGVMPVALKPYMRICSISFEQLSTPAEVPYYKKQNAKYINQKGPTVSRINRDL